MSRPTDMSKKTRLGVLVCNRLKDMGKNQKYLAQKSGLTQVYVYQVLNGQYSPSLKALIGISKATGIGIEELTKALLDES